MIFLSLPFSFSLSFSFPLPFLFLASFCKTRDSDKAPQKRYPIFGNQAKTISFDNGSYRIPWCHWCPTNPVWQILSTQTGYTNGDLSNRHAELAWFNQQSVGTWLSPRFLRAYQIQRISNPGEFGIETPSNSTINVENQTAWPKQHWYNTIWERQWHKIDVHILNKDRQEHIETTRFPQAGRVMTEHCAPALTRTPAKAWFEKWSFEC